MRTYQTKQSLVDEINRTFQLFRSEFSEIEPDHYDTRVEGVDKTPREMIAYQIGWLRLVRSWDADESRGEVVVTPSPDYKWNQLGQLYQHFYEACQSYTPVALLDEFEKAKDDFVEWVESLDESVLFEPSARAWATTTAQWPVWKWVHINSVAPFTSFRTLVRRWKRNVEAGL